MISLAAWITLIAPIDLALFAAVTMTMRRRRRSRSLRARIAHYT